MNPRMSDQKVQSGRRITDVMEKVFPQIKTNLSRIPTMYFTLENNTYS